MALLLALVAIALEIHYEVMQNIVLWRPTASGQRVFRMVNDVPLICLAAIFVVLMGVYFDGPVPNGTRHTEIASFSTPDLKLAKHVFLPAWVLLLYGSSLFLHNLINFNPDPQRLCCSWVTFFCTMSLLLSVYLVLLFLPLMGFCFKYNNYYAHTHWVDNMPLQPSYGLSAEEFGLGTNNSSNSSFPSGREDVDARLWTGIQNGTRYTGYLARPNPTTYAALRNFPLAVILSPLMFFVLVLCVMTLVNAVVHYKQLVRYQHLLPEVNPSPAGGAGAGARGNRGA